jgi:hypothetical protein
MFNDSDNGQTQEDKWREIIKKNCEYEYHPQQDICFCKLNVGYICWWKNCPLIQKAN